MPAKHDFTQHLRGDGPQTAGPGGSGESGAGTPPRNSEIAGLVLAGGLARRFNGADKGLVSWAGRPLVEWAIGALAPQTACVLISANRNLAVYAAYGLPVLADRHPGYLGPLAGIASALAAAPTPWVLCLPCDAPCPPPDLGARLARALAAGRAEIAAASDGARLHPLHALIPKALAASLEDYLASGERSVLGWYRRHRLAIADCADCPLAFANLNTPQEAARLIERRAERAPVRDGGDAPT